MGGVIGLIAGRGELPRVFVREATRRGLRVVVVELAMAGAATASGPADGKLSGRAARAWRWRLDPSRWDELAKILADAGVRDVYVAGKMDRLRATALLEQAAAGEVRRLYEQGRFLGDQALSQLFADSLARHGLRLGEQREVLGDLLMPAGVLTARAPDARELADVRRGQELAARLAELDIGQTVVVKNGVVLAAEAAVEGTDATIRRGGRLGGPGGVVVKAARRDQDLRLDTPVVGPGTIRAMIAAGACCLAVQAGRCFLVHPDRVRAAADRAGIAIVGW